MARKWVLTLYEEGVEHEGGAPQLELAEDEIAEIAEQVAGSCLETEDSLVWLFQEAGAPLPEDDFVYTLNVHGTGSDSTMAARILEVLTEAGIDAALE